MITFACYGQHLHGDPAGSVNPLRNRYGSPVLQPSASLAEAEFRELTNAPYLLDGVSGAVVLQSVREVCLNRGWSLLPAHVRTTHVHVVVEAEVRPEKIMGYFKTYASRALNRLEGERTRWARHGSTRWLWKDRDVQTAIKYVVEEQGEPMAISAQGS